MKTRNYIMTLLVILTLFSCKNVVEDTEHYRINPEDCFTKPHNNLGFSAPARHCGKPIPH